MKCSVKYLQDQSESRGVFNTPDVVSLCVLKNQNSLIVISQKGANLCHTKRVIQNLRGRPKSLLRDAGRDRNCHYYRRDYLFCRTGTGRNRINCTGRCRTAVNFRCGRISCPDLCDQGLLCLQPGRRSGGLWLPNLCSTKSVMALGS